ncbi:Rho termination factor N-terminal domain-containing protein [Streptomyces lydicamycinicus]|uniref:Rho termination factor N-terminal domain-containing protein n=1 Tax=Streptomyces lydicamycinicus TaxID=1546107 RepID=UPI003C2BD5EE
MPSKSAEQARTSLARGAYPRITSKDLDEWEARWAPVLRDVFYRDVDKNLSAELAERLDEARKGRPAVRRVVAGKAEVSSTASEWKGVVKLRRSAARPYDPDRDDLHMLGVEKLRSLARKEGIAGAHRMRKEELLNAISRRRRGGRG